MKLVYLIFLLSWIISTSSSNHLINEQGFIIIDSQEMNIYPDSTDLAYFIPTKGMKTTFDKKNLKKGYRFSQMFGPVTRYRNNFDTLCDESRCIVYFPADVTYRRPGLGFNNKYEANEIFINSYKKKIKYTLSTEYIILEEVKPL
mgnify:CR=1 FL=1